MSTVQTPNAGLIQQEDAMSKNETTIVAEANQVSELEKAEQRIEELRTQRDEAKKVGNDQKAKDLNSEVSRLANWILGEKAVAAWDTFRNFANAGKGSQELVALAAFATVYGSLFPKKADRPEGANDIYISKMAASAITGGVDNIANMLKELATALQNAITRNAHFKSGDGNTVAVFDGVMSILNTSGKTKGEFRAACIGGSSATNSATK